MYALLLVIHVIVCLVLIFVVLLQAGRGGGFSDMLGGGQPQSLFGSQTNAFMVKATEVCAVIFILSSLGLGLLSSRGSRSLIGDQTTMPVAAPAVVPSIPEPPQAPPTAQQSAVPVAASAAAQPVAAAQSSAPSQAADAHAGS